VTPRCRPETGRRSSDDRSGEEEFDWPRKLATKAAPRKLVEHRRGTELLLDPSPPLFTACTRPWPWPPGQTEGRRGEAPPSWITPFLELHLPAGLLRLERTEACSSSRRAGGLTIARARAHTPLLDRRRVERDAARTVFIQSDCAQSTVSKYWEHPAISSDGGLLKLCFVAFIGFILYP
jgi:hypothetical protein